VISTTTRRRLMTLPLGAALGAAALGMPALAQRARTLRLGSPQPVESNYHRAALMFADEVAKLSGNKLKVEVFPNSQLGSINSMLSSVQVGSLSMTLAVPAWYSGLVKQMNVFTLPFLVSSPDRLRPALDGALGAAVRPKLEAAGFHPLGWWLMGARHMVNNVHPIFTPDDVAGLKMRVISSQVYIQMFKLLGANPVVVDSAEIYLALQQKLVDGLEYPIPDMIDAKLYEVSKFMSLTAHVTDFFVVTMNNDLWQGMSAEEQGIISQAMKTASDWEWQAQPQTTAAAEQKIATLLKINPVSPEQRALFAAKTRPIYQQYTDVVGQDLLDLATQQLAV
jgi:tripartite ATP-independent transporter DctP family solute receptor